MARWAWEVRDLAGVGRGELQPRAAEVTRQLNGTTELTVELDGRDAGDLATTARVVRGWRAPVGGGSRTLRVAAEMAQIAAEASTDRGELVTAVGTGGVGVFSARYVQQTAVYVATTPGALLNDRIAHQNARGHHTGLSDVIAADGGPPRDRTYDPGKSEGEILEQLAAVDDGFWYREDPIDADGPAFSELVLLYPDAGGDSGARFGWGPGSVGNLSAAGVEVRRPTNAVIALGAGDGAEQLRHRIVDEASAEVYGLFDQVITHPDVIIPETLQGHAQAALRLTPPRLFRVSVAGVVGTPGVPAPWDGFDVGETVTLDLRGAAPVLQYSGPARVTSFTVRVDADGVERVTRLDLAEL